MTMTSADAHDQRERDVLGPPGDEGGHARRRGTAAARGRARPRGGGRRVRRWPRGRPAGSGAAAAGSPGGTSASRWAKTRNDAAHRVGADAGQHDRHPHAAHGTTPGVGRQRRRVARALTVDHRLGEGAGRDAAERTEEHREVARARLVGEQRDETADERGDRGGPGADGGHEEHEEHERHGEVEGQRVRHRRADEDPDDRADLPVGPEQQGRAEVVGHLVVEPGRGRPAGRLGVGLLRPPGDRDGVGLVGQQVAHEQPAPQRDRGEVRGERRGVEEQPQVDGARGDHRDQGGASVGQRIGRRELGRAREHDGGQPDRRRPHRARSWRALRPPPGRTGSPRRASVPPLWPPPAARRGRSGSAPEHHAVSPRGRHRD